MLFSEYLSLFGILLGITWALWITVNVLVITIAPRIMSFDMLGPHVRGLMNQTIIVPQWVSDKLEIMEYLAIYLHECGHIRSGHIRDNFLWGILIPWPRSERTAERQELQADDWVIKCGYGKWLASAIRKLSTEGFDLERAQRAERAAAES